MKFTKYFTHGPIKTLDVACGGGAFSIVAAKNGNYVLGVDYDAHNIRVCHEYAAAYTIKATQLFLGFDVEVKAATLYIDPTLQVDLYGGAFLVNKNGIASEVAWGFDNFYQCNYEIWGSKGKITAERAFTPPPDMKPKIVLERAEKRVEFLAPNDNHFVNILKEFHRAIVERDIKPHLEETLNQSRLLEDVRQKSASLQEST